MELFKKDQSYEYMYDIRMKREFQGERVKHESVLGLPTFFKNLVPLVFVSILTIPLPSSRIKHVRRLFNDDGSLL